MQGRACHATEISTPDGRLEKEVAERVSVDVDAWRYRVTPGATPSALRHANLPAPFGAGASSATLALSPLLTTYSMRPALALVILSRVYGSQQVKHSHYGR
ncbi:hypothetical protein NMD64_15335 [Edwardsiella tarda]|uniref:hypothetical protein n=1 Tax=Edwardsiella tarda TaxID=636 RepID=UPI00351C357B